MTIEELNKRKTPIVVIDNSLEKYRNYIISPVKLEKANNAQKRIGFPKIIK